MQVNTKKATTSAEVGSHTPVAATGRPFTKGPRIFYHENRGPVNHQKGEYHMKLMNFLDTLAPETLVWLCTGENDETDYILLKEVYAFRWEEVRGYRVRRAYLKWRPENSEVCLAVVVKKKNKRGDKK